MLEPNDQTINPSPPKQLCQIQVMFPVVSDERAIELKKQVESLLIEVPNAQTHFTIMPIPNTPKR